ncbi:topoisomerase IV [[Mycoplasma] phocae]|uniref:DNA topoisomerase (ATP-hydrolyzing) n=1 Tax=[Mycoplasma] phocae TaxID=142651 RepID=A0A2Z5IQI9_9BACT|nr:DNA topoisomerase (ATP-hydrolyzing) [[Mycoplasma] phocae]AXE60822.1 topoisomerase IV [[Mycoplasma] phocae]
MNKNKKEQIDQITENIIERNMVDIMNERFGRYSKYIIQQRAIPDSRDGLKPVQRRILYSMWNLKLRNKEPFKKSARIVGDVIGRYHPHGDSSIYEALVRMAQEWKSNYPLIEMHGNKGSIDDDPAAAMRYTESRLEKISELMLKDLDRKVVAMAPNFDDSEYEPVVLPTLFPNLLINGAKGIAAGFATEIPPHNLGEVIDATIAMIKNPIISIPSLLKIVKGPDFPTGGIINGTDGIEKALETGQGKIMLSSQYQYVKNKKDEIIGIEIKEIPFGVVKSKLVADIDSIAIDKIISGIKEVRDESDRSGISIYLDLEEDSSPEAIMTYLMNKTDLRISYNYNMVAIDNNAPCLLNLQTALFSYLTHLKEINTNGIKFDLQKYKLRLEIVEGFIKVAEISDEVIKVIKNSDNSKRGVIEALIRVFNFTELQATAIAELRLYKLSRMDQIEFQNEKTILEENIQKCNLLLNDQYEFNKFLIKQLLEIKKEYAKPRKTQITEEKIKTDVDHKLLAKNEDFYFFISKEGYIKKINLKIFNANQISNYKLKENDILQYYDKINSLSKIIFFTNLGNFFILEAHILKDNGWKELGTHISTFVSLESNEHVIRVMEIVSFDSYIEIILISKYGFAKKVKINDFDSKLSAKKRRCMSFKNNDDELVDAKIANNEKSIFIILNNGGYYFIDESVFNSTLDLKAQGIKLFSKLQTKDKIFISAFAMCSPFNSLLMITADGYGKKWRIQDIESVQRWGRGSRLYNVLNKVDCKPMHLEVISDSLEFLYTNSNNEICHFDLNKFDHDSSRIDKLIKLNYDFQNPGALIQPIKINELKDLNFYEQENSKVKFLEIENASKNNKNFIFDTQTTLCQRYYINNFGSSEDQSQQSESPDDEDEIALFAENEIKLEPKRSFEEKMEAMNHINVDSLIEKVKEIKKK